MLLELVIVFVIALLGIFAVGFRSQGPWGSLWTFFLVVILVSWAVGLWLVPFGPPLWGVYWMPYIFVALMVALLLAAVTPGRPLRSRDEAMREQKRARQVAMESSLFFWLFIIFLGAAILSAYFGWPA